MCLSHFSLTPADFWLFKKMGVVWFWGNLQRAAVRIAIRSRKGLTQIRGMDEKLKGNLDPTARDSPRPENDM